MPTPFSRVYCAPEQLLRDSGRLRSRLGRYCTSHLEETRHELVRYIELETGARVPLVGVGYASLDRFFATAELRDVLDAITHVQVKLRSLQRPQAAGAWHAFAVRVLAEEHSTYEIRADGSVAYRVDEAYAASRKATLAGLADARWNASRAEFERAFEAMDSDPPDTNSAVRAIAASLEAAAKVKINNAAASIGPPEVERHLWPVIRERYANDPTAQNAAHQQLKTYKEWITATHQYRHGQGHGDEVRAPEDLTISLLTVGAGILRWMISSE